MQVKTILASVAATALMIGQGVAAQDEQVRAVDELLSADSLGIRDTDEPEMIQTREPRRTRTRLGVSTIGIPEKPIKLLRDIDEPEMIQTREPRRTRTRLGVSTIGIPEKPIKLLRDIDEPETIKTREPMLLANKGICRGSACSRRFKRRIRIPVPNPKETCRRTGKCGRASERSLEARSLRLRSPQPAFCAKGSNCKVRKLPGVPRPAKRMVGCLALNCRKPSPLLGDLPGKNTKKSKGRKN